MAKRKKLSNFSYTLILQLLAVVFIHWLYLFVLLMNL